MARGEEKREGGMGMNNGGEGREEATFGHISVINKMILCSLATDYSKSTLPDTFSLSVKFTTTNKHHCYSVMTTAMSCLWE